MSKSGWVRADRGVPRRPIAERFMEKVDRTGECWLWTASLVGNGYGKFFSHKVDGRRAVFVYAHRWAYEHLMGEIPAGLELDHLCSVRRCVNPAHLEPVTRQENLRRAAAKRTTCRHGHPYDGVNNKGHRTCSTCLRASELSRQPRRKKRA